MNKYFITQNTTEFQTDTMGVSIKCLTMCLVQYPLGEVLIP